MSCRASSRRYALGVALLLVGCGGCKKSNPANKIDAGAHSTVTPNWNPGLADAARLTVSGSFVLGEWVSVLSAEPTPPEIRAFLSATGEQTQRDRGWVLYGGASPNNAVVVDESSTELTYVVRTFSRPANEAVELPPPADGVWPLRAVACGNDPSTCAVVRWAPPAGADSIQSGQAERLAVTVVDANAMSAQKTFMLQSLDLYAGTTTVGGIYASPTRPELYVVEWDPNDAAALFIRCVSLSTGEDRWRSRLPSLAGSTRNDDQIVLPTPDGSQIVVARGDFAYGVLLLAELSVIDSTTGAITTVPSIPEGWQKVILLPDFDGAAIIALRIQSSRWPGTESPTIAFLGVARFDARSRSFSDLLDPAADAKTPAEVEERRWRTPTAGLMVGLHDLLLVPAGSSLPGQDTTDPDRRRRREKAMDRLLGREPR